MSSQLVQSVLHSAEHRARLQALRTVALFEFAKGVLVLIAVFSLYWLQPTNVAGAFLNLLHISPDRHFAHLLMQMADKLSNIKLWHLVLGASCYSGLRFAEAVGLWRARAWAEWIALISGALYLPLEIQIFLRHPTLFHAAVLIVNLAIVAFMFYLRIYVPHQEKHEAAQPGIH
jgi:uncharacterized membrane protein (DUF2068 family)